jgi:hypothetical protein
LIVEPLRPEAKVPSLTGSPGHLVTPRGLPQSESGH